MRSEYKFSEITSTQDYAKSKILSGDKNFLVLSDYQTDGRGRSGRAWESTIGGLWFSFDEEFYEKNNLITLSIGVAVREVLYEEYGCDVKLKWPNDLILEDKKVGGIICEKVNDRVLIGIGINTNNKKLSLDNAITFLNFTGKTVENYSIMKSIINRCEDFIKAENSVIIKLFRNNMAYKERQCFISSLKQKAKIIDIDFEGKLIVETDKGIKEIISGEINLCT